MEAACNLPGCVKPISAPNRLACGELHHLLIMAQRYHKLSNTSATSSSSRPDHPLLGFPPQQGRRTPPQQAQLLLGLSQRQSEGLCAFLSCSKPSASPGHAWCSRRHCLEWLRAFYGSLVPDQICKPHPECTRHVFVDADVHTGSVRAHPFCGWRHCQEYQKRVALCNILPSPAPAPLSQLSSSDEGFFRREPSEESLIKGLINYAVFGMPAKGIKVMKDFYTKHPWEVLQQYPEGGCCLLITRCLYKGKEQKRELTTKDQYHWKQHGRPSKVTAEACKRYFRYRKLRGKKRNRSEISNDNPFTMVEFSIVEGEFYNKCKGYSLVKLSASQAQTAACKCSRKEVQVQGDEAENNNLPPDNAARVGDQVSYSLDALDFPLEDWSFAEEGSTFDLGIFEGLDSSSTFRHDELEPWMI